MATLIPQSNNWMEREMSDEERVVYRAAVDATMKMFDEVRAHIQAARKAGQPISEFLIDALTPIGRVQAVQEYVRLLEGVMIESAPYLHEHGRVGWRSCFIFPEEPKSWN